MQKCGGGDDVRDSTKQNTCGKTDDDTHPCKRKEQGTETTWAMKLKL